MLNLYTLNFVYMITLNLEPLIDSVLDFRAFVYVQLALKAVLKQRRQAEKSSAVYITKSAVLLMVLLDTSLLTASVNIFIQTSLKLSTETSKFNIGQVHYRNVAWAGLIII